MRARAKAVNWSGERTRLACWRSRPRERKLFFERLSPSDGRFRRRRRNEHARRARSPDKNRSTKCAFLRYAENGNMPKLIITTEVQGKIAYEFTEKLITIGRATDNMIVIDDPSVSGRHAQLQLAGEIYRVKDLDSTNGTRVNGVPVTETGLRFDDRIRFGAIEARFEPDARGSQPLPALEQIEAKPAESSAAPVDFANASPFRQRAKDRDPTRNAILAAAAVALVAFLASMIAVLAMHAPMF